MSSNKINTSKLATNGTEATILRIARDYPNISRSGIAIQGRLPHAAISRSVSKLLEKLIVKEEPLADKRGPRRKRGIGLNPEFGYVLGIEYGSFKVEGVAVDISYNILTRKTELVSLESMSRDDKIKKIISFIKSLLGATSSLPGKCLGLAVVDPGAVDQEKGLALMSTILHDWSDVPIVKILEDSFDLPVMLSSTPMSKIRAADRLDVEGTSRNILYVEYSEEAIACGLKLEGNYIFGELGLAGDLGHLRVTDRPVPCKCGGFGCLESIASLPALARKAKEATVEDSNSVLSGMDKIDGPSVLAAAAAGDRLASHIVDEAFDYLGRGVGGIVNIVNPEIVLFDRIVSTAGPKAVATLMRSLSKNTLSSHGKMLNIRISKIKSHIGALGGAMATLDHCLGK